MTNWFEATVQPGAEGSSFVTIEQEDSPDSLTHNALAPYRTERTVPHSASTVRGNDVTALGYPALDIDASTEFDASDEHKSLALDADVAAPLAAISAQYNRFKEAVSAQADSSSPLGFVKTALLSIPTLGMQASSDMAAYRVHAMDRSLSEHAIVKTLRLMSPLERASLPDGLIANLCYETEFSPDARETLRSLFDEDSDIEWSLAKAVHQNLESDLNRFSEAVSDQANYANPLVGIANLLVPFRAESDAAWYRIQDYNKRQSEAAIVDDLLSLTPQERTQIPVDILEKLVNNSDFSESTQNRIAALLNANQNMDSLNAEINPVTQIIQNGYEKYKFAIESDRQYPNNPAELIAALNGLVRMTIATNNAYGQIEELAQQRAQLELLDNIRNLSPAQRQTISPTLRVELLSRDDFSIQVQTELKQLLS